VRGGRGVGTLTFNISADQKKGRSRPFFILDVVKMRKFPAFGEFVEMFEEDVTFRNHAPAFRLFR
jgi:hypothetical protein